LGVLGQCIGVAALGGLAVGAVADFLSAQIAVGISALLGILLLIPVIIMTPLFHRQVTSPQEDVGAELGVGEASKEQSSG